MPRSRAKSMLLAATIVVVGLIGAGPAYADSSVVGLWHFDEGSGFVAGDSSGLGNNGALIGGVTWVPGVGVSGSALEFDGTTGLVDVPDSASLEPQQLTVQAWVKRPGSPGDYKAIVDKGVSGCIAGSWELNSGPNGGLNFSVSIPGGPPSNNGLTYAHSPDPGPGIWDGNWHLITGTFDGSTVRLYVDGAQVGSGTPLAGPIAYGLPDSNDLFFAAYGANANCPGYGNFDYPGVIDEVEIWNRALTPAQISAEFPYPELVLSPPSATIAYGASQSYTATALDAHNNNVGTVTGSTTFTIAPDGTCSGATCTPASPGPHTITGTDSAVPGIATPVTGTATLNVTKAATSLAAPPLGVVNSILALVPTLTATLTSQGAPVSGQRVAFTFSAAPKSTACTATTNASGVASCKAGGLLPILTVLASSSYTASYAGDGDYLATSTTAPVVLLSLGGKTSSALRKLTGHARALLRHDLKVCSSLAHHPTKAARRAAARGPRCVASTIAERTGGVPA
jgi:hypothetical protein